jgi:hypothetical protein
MSSLQPFCWSRLVVSHGQGCCCMPAQATCNALVVCQADILLHCRARLQCIKACVTHCQPPLASALHCHMPHPAGPLVTAVEALLYRSRSASTLYAGWRIQHGCHTAEHLAPQHAPETGNTAQVTVHMLSHASTFHHYTARVQDSAAVLWLLAVGAGTCARGPNLTTHAGLGPHCPSESWAKDHLTVGLPHPLCHESESFLV